MKRRALLWVLAMLVAAAAPTVARAQGTLNALDTDVDQIANAARPSVVTLLAQHTVERQRRSETTHWLHTRVGSGVAVDDDLILTTASVLLGAERVMVRTISGLQVDGKIVGQDLVYNIALVRVQGAKLPPVRFAERAAQPGDWVITLGTSYRGQSTQSIGNVATIYPDPCEPLLQLTNTVYPGNSGGAALNARGELIGLVQGELGNPEPGGRTPESDRRPGGMSFVQPVSAMRTAYATLLRDGHVAHGLLGVSTRSASVASETEPGTRVPIGALVEHVQPGGPAMKAGLRKGDLIVGFNRERVEYADYLARWVASTVPGTDVDLVWVRNEIQHQARVRLGLSPDAAPQWALAPGDSGGGGGAGPGALQSPRIADLERQIQQLNLELRRLRGDSTTR